MDDIPKIELNRVRVAKVVEPQPVREELVVHEMEVAPVKEHSNKKYIVLAVVLVFLLTVIGGAYVAFKTYIVWDDESTEAVEKKAAYIPVARPVQAESESILRGEAAAATTVKGKITVLVRREDNLPFMDSTVKLIGAGGSVVKEGTTGKDGIVTFDQISAGTYTLSASNKGEKRAATQKITLEEGEIKDAKLSLFLDTDVDITVTVKNMDGSPAANQSFTIQKIRSSESPLEYTVETDESGIFTKRGISPDDKWILLVDNEEVGSFTVSPTGKAQTINVTTTSN